MGFDYAKAEQEFRDELDAGKFGIEYMPNSGYDYGEMEELHVETFNEYLESDVFNALADEVFRQN